MEPLLPVEPQPQQPVGLPLPVELLPLEAVQQGVEPLAVAQPVASFLEPPGLREPGEAVLEVGAPVAPEGPRAVAR